MNKLDMHKIKQRERVSNSLYSRDLDDYSEIRLWNESNSIFFEKNTMDKIHNWKGLNENSNIAFNNALDTFNELLENSLSICRIQSTCNYLLDEMKLVNNAQQLKKSIKGKLAYMNRKNNANIHDKMMKKNILSSSTLQKNINSRMPRDINGREYDRKKIIEECYDRLYDEAKNIYECDRIIANYNRISKRFKLENLITRLNNGSTNLYSTIQEIAYLIDTFQAPFRNIYNSTLETCWYLFNKKYINFNNSAIIEAATDYFILNDGLLDSEIDDIKSISETSVIMDKDDFKCINYLFESKEDSIKVTNGKPDNKISIELKKDYKEPEKCGNHKEPFSYTVFKKPKDTEGGVPDFSDYGVGGKETERKKYPLYSKLKEAVIENSARFNKDIVIDYINKYKFIVATKYGINEDHKSKIKEYVTTLSNIANNIDGNILLDNLPYILSFTSANFIYIDKEDLDALLEIILEICKKIISANESNIHLMLDIIERSNKYLCKHAEVIEKINNNEYEYYSRYINEFHTKITRYFTEYEHLYLKDNNYVVNKDSIEEYAGIITIERLMKSILENINNLDVSHYIANNISNFNEDFNVITDYINNNTNIINRDVIKESMISYRNSLRKNNTIYNIIKINAINESIDDLSQARPYKTDKSISHTIESLMQLENLLNNINEDAKYSFKSDTEDIINIKLAKLPSSILDKTNLSKIDYDLIQNSLIDLHNSCITDKSPNEYFIASCIDKAMINIFHICLQNSINIWTKSILKLLIQWYAEFYSNKLRSADQREIALKSLDSIFDLIIQKYSNQNNDDNINQFYKELNYSVKMARDRILYRYHEDLENGILRYRSDSREE